MRVSQPVSVMTLFEGECWNWRFVNQCRQEQAQLGKWFLRPTKRGFRDRQGHVESKCSMNPATPNQMLAPNMLEAMTYGSLQIANTVKGPKYRFRGLWWDIRRLYHPTAHKYTPTVVQLFPYSITRNISLWSP